MAVIVYYRNNLATMLSDWLGWLRGAPATADSMLVWFVIIGTLPVGVCGILMSDGTEQFLRSPRVIAAATMAFALLLWWADSMARRISTPNGLTWKVVMMISTSQVLALIPGTSRSGITITAGLMLGLRRELAARFSFLLSIPVIALAGIAKIYQVSQGGNEIALDFLLIGVVVSGATAYLTIGWFMRLLERVGLFPFVVYRLLLGVVLFWVFA
jgi:undecaprenyl-diphosphatase